MKTVIIQHQTEIIFSVAIIISLIIWKFALKKSTNKIALLAGFNIARTKLMFKYINVLMFFIALFALLVIWGVDIREVTIIFSSVFAVIGIGLFAVWSVLSNITSGIIMFFSFPYKIGDKIQIHDKDAPIEGIIEDIKAFQIHLRNDKNELITYPNNLILQKPVTLIEKFENIDGS
ncbi:MAG: mechanosensitive ion channel domain-containing protein [Bacteroidota bacterium]